MNKTQNETRHLLRNAIQCPDGTILESTHGHDFQHHTQEDGREYFVDGGLNYQRIGYSDEEFTDLSVYSDDPHETIREAFKWTRNFDKNGKRLQKSEQRLLKELSNDHIESLCYFTVKGYPDFINKVFVDEHNYRIDNNIVVDDY